MEHEGGGTTKVPGGARLQQRHKGQGVAIHEIGLERTTSQTVGSQRKGGQTWNHIERKMNPQEERQSYANRNKQERVNKKTPLHVLQGKKGKEADRGWQDEN